MATMFDKIKKQNGEKFAKAIRNYNNGIFDVSNLDHIVKYAGRDAEPIMNYLVSLMNVQIAEHTVHQDPIKLLDIAGYNAFVADTLEKQNSIAKYFAPDEELCTFKDPIRFQEYHIIHAVKKNVDDIKRENFKKPARQDEYGTSVISIQILKSGGFISIKNRYNHMVQNSDNTFNSNPDNIIMGLGDALKHYFDVDFTSQRTVLPGGYTLFRDQIVKYNYELNNTYVGDNFYVQNGTADVVALDKNSQLMMDYFILDIKNRKLLNPSNEYDAFYNTFNDMLATCKKLEVKKESNNQRGIYLDGVCCARVRDGDITYLHLPNVKQINPLFLCHNTKLTHLSLPDVEYIGDCAFKSNQELISIDAPNVKTIGQDFLYRNKKLTSVSFPALESVGSYFLYSNEILTSLSMPNVRDIGANFLVFNKKMTDVSLPNAFKIADGFVYNNQIIKSVSLPHVITVGNDFLYANTELKSLSLPSVAIIGKLFLSNNKQLAKIDLPCVSMIDDGFLFYNNKLTDISLPNAKKIGKNFLRYNEKIPDIALPRIESISESFMGILDDDVIDDVVQNKYYRRPTKKEQFIDSMQTLKDKLAVYYGIKSQEQDKKGIK